MGVEASSTTGADEQLLEELDPDKGKTCVMCIPHPYDKNAEKALCGRPGYCQVEVLRTCCGKKGILVLCKVCWEHDGQNPNVTVNHRISSGHCGSYSIAKCAISWRLL